MADFILLKENGDDVGLEDGTGFVLLETSPFCLLLTEDGFHITLEDGSGSLALEECPPDVLPPEPEHGGRISVAPRRHIRETRRPGRFRASAAHVRVIAYAPILSVTLNATGRHLATRAFAGSHSFVFRIHPAQAKTGFWKRRGSDREQQIRWALIADLFDRDHDK